MVSNAKKATAAVPVAAHLRPEGLKFLRGLEKNNDREWFRSRKAVYEAELKEPMLAVVRKITDAMMAFAPSHVRPAEAVPFQSAALLTFTAGLKLCPFKTCRDEHLLKGTQKTTSP